MSINLSINKKTKTPAVKFTPDVSQTNAKEHMQVLLDTFPQMLMDIISNMYPMLRPVTEEERNAHAYVFLEGEEGELENKIYRAKKHCYDILTQLFSSTLTALFPDVEYIIQCANYHQDYVFSHSEDEVDAYQKEIEDVTKYVRENIKSIIEDMIEDMSDELNEEDTDGATNVDQESI